MSIFGKKDNKNIETDSYILDARTPFAIYEAYKSLYTNVRYLNIEDPSKKIVVTSAVSGEGKTTLSVNLSITIAQNLEEKKVLLIDADMRRPRVASSLNIDKDTHGLSEFLAGIDSKPNIVYIPEHKLHVLSSGGKNINPTKLIGSDRMHQLLDKYASQFDYVIIDTPPVNVVADAVLLNSYVSGYIIATRSEYSNVNKLNECISTLEQVGAEVLGIVLSDVKVKKSEGRYSRYGRYSDDV